MIEINGMAHVILSVSNWPACRAFYTELLPFLGMSLVFDGEDMIYYVGARTALGISKCDEQHDHERFVQNSVGLHHLCFRARNNADVDAVQELLVSMGATIVHGTEPGPWAPGYYSVLFEDPVGTRLEVNHVPGKGLLADDVTLNPVDDYR
ncbi:MAG: VOC family protein [Pseudomonadota bacterium]|nr:VOC family protein [Pseudomonadota bacterium]